MTESAAITKNKNKNKKKRIIKKRTNKALRPHRKAQLMERDTISSCNFTIRVYSNTCLYKFHPRAIL